MVQLHDELDISVKDEAQSKKIIDIMENAVPLEIPNKVDYEFGENWGSIEVDNEDSIDENFI